MRIAILRRGSVPADMNDDEVMDDHDDVGVNHEETDVGKDDSDDSDDQDNDDGYQGDRS